MHVVQCKFFWRGPSLQPHMNRLDEHSLHSTGLEPVPPLTQVLGLQQSVLHYSGTNMLILVWQCVVQTPHSCWRTVLSA